MQIRTFEWQNIDASTRARLLSRSQSGIEEVLDSVRTVVSAVRKEGDAAVRRFTREFDHADTADLPLVLTHEEIESGIDRTPPDVRRALDYAIENVRMYHDAHSRKSSADLEIRPGVFAREVVRPIESVGLYVPRGRGSFPSMLYMLAVPASLAGVPRIVVCTPPDADGTIDPACLYAARKCGVKAIVRAGGAQAIAALAYGTESIAEVVKIVGPGSVYVAAAKRIVRDDVDTGLPAGPSESIIVADDTADHLTVCLDLLVEAEHGADSQALLVTTSSNLAGRVADRLPDLIRSTPEPRRGFLLTGFDRYSGIVMAKDRDELARIVNEFAPEHLQVRVKDPYDFVELIRTAGEILVGEMTPFSIANYAIGANAVLPTGGAARVHSGVSVGDFQRSMSVMTVRETGYAEIASAVVELAEYEGFHWHAKAAAERLERSREGSVR